MAAHDVVPGRDAVVGHAEADRALVLVGLPFGDELVRDAPAVVEPVELKGDRAVPVEPEPAQRILDLVDRLAALGWPVILGNADAFLLEVPSDSPEPLTQGHLDKREWTLAQLEPRHLDQIRSFAPTIDFELEDGLVLRAFHASPRSYDDVILPDTPDAQVEALLGGSGVDLLAGGHTHMQWTRYVDGALFVNPGSVRDDGAYAIVTGGSVEFRRATWQSES